MKRRALVITALAYLSTVVGANWAINHLGTAPLGPGAPHTIHVGFGLTAPSGVLFVAAALILRDLVQYLTGVKRGKQTLALMTPLILAGAGLSFAIANPKVALASAVAFMLSELVDYGLFTWTAPEPGTASATPRRWSAAVLAGGAAGAVADSLIFLSIAFGSVAFWQGQIVGKCWGVGAAAVVIAFRRRHWVPVTA